MNEMIYIKNYNTESGTVLAMCDQELIGNIYSEGKLELDLKSYSEFYVGELINEEEVETYIEGELYSANIVGKRSVGIVVSKGIVSRDDVKEVGGVPFVHIYTMV
ncbi:MAG: DUF424 family protein [Candidatus Marsarchaeota archaeon]|jgi:hypothetical protein|nr:DUF424 family protein [Candidatus Marsarchaeota archaeon]